MNPFTRFLRQWASDPDLNTFVDHWDALEALVIRVYKQGQAARADEAEYQALRRWLRANYASWKGPLQSFFSDGAKSDGGSPGPMEELLHVERASGFVDNWSMMQKLPAAREALNRLVLKRGGVET